MDGIELETKDIIDGLAWTADGRLLLATERGLVGWDPTQDEPSLLLPTKGLRGVAPHPVDPAVVVLDRLASLERVDLASGASVPLAPDLWSPLGAQFLGFDLDGRYVAASADRGSVVWDASTGERVLELGAGPRILALGRGVAVVQEDEHLVVRQIATEEEVSRWEVDALSLESVAMSPFGQSVAVGASSGSLEIRSLATGRLQSMTSWPGHWLTRVWYLDPERLLVQLEGGRIRMVDLKGRELATPFPKCQLVAADPRTGLLAVTAPGAFAVCRP